MADAVERDLPEVEVLAVELGGPELMRIFIDRAGGVDHALCERVTNVLRPYLNEYSLEVSSPGIERPLRKREHFERAAGRRVALRTSHDVAGRKRFRGEVVTTGEREVTVAVADGGQFDVPYDAIVRGNLIDDGAKT
ncbi:MAG: ribosome maturation factor RimP [Actinobacteria bacterium]|nr:ribosome maturation factor RimP [Actinomycetota bacterium]